MSKRNRRAAAHRSYWSLILAGLGVLLVAGIVIFGAWQKDDAGDGPPILAVDKKLIDYGEVKNFSEKSFAITVTNTGTGTLRFKEKPYVEVVEGCCPPNVTTGSLTLQPGESTTVTSAIFSMHPGMDGKHNYAVHLVSNDPQQPDMVVNVLSNWGP